MLVGLSQPAAVVSPRRNVPVSPHIGLDVGAHPYAGMRDPMPKPASVHVCSACGHETARWAGRCPGCGEWNSLVEQIRVGGSARGGGAGSGADARLRAAPVAPVALADVEAVDHERLSTGIGELDNVL